jgi:hypothetical protein
MQHLPLLHRQGADQNCYASVVTVQTTTPGTRASICPWHAAAFTQVQHTTQTVSTPLFKTLKFLIPVLDPCLTLTHSSLPRACVGLSNTRVSTGTAILPRQLPIQPKECGNKQNSKAGV